MMSLLHVFSVYPAMAATGDAAAAFGKVIDPIITNVVYPLVALVFAIAILVFAYGVLQIVMNGTDADAHKRGKMAIASGLIGMFIMMSAWGIIYLVSHTVTQIKP